MAMDGHLGFSDYLKKGWGYGTYNYPILDLDIEYPILIHIPIVL